jgi:hypothetical protein
MKKRRIVKATTTKTKTIKAIKRTLYFILIRFNLNILNCLIYSIQLFVVVVVVIVFLFLLVYKLN